MEASKPGYRTTEFWITLLSILVVAAQQLGLIGADEAQEIERAGADAITYIASAAVAVAYIIGRVAVKMGK